MSACHNPAVPPGFKSAEDKILLSMKIDIVGQPVSLKTSNNLYSFYHKIFAFLFNLFIIFFLSKLLEFY